MTETPPNAMTKFPNAGAGPAVQLREHRRLFGGKVKLVTLPNFTDARGSLVPLEFSQLPFVPSRAFIVHHTPADTVRGGHAHALNRQLLLCVAGRLAVRLLFKGQEENVVLENASQGLVIDPGVWAEQRYVEPGTTVCVFSSEPYDPDDYLTDSEHRCG